jgi:hypothetical protein
LSRRAFKRIRIGEPMKPQASRNPLCRKRR